MMACPSPMLGIAMRLNAVKAVLVASVATLLSANAYAQQPLFDAGRQSMIMHKGDLLEQQTTPNNGTTNARNQKSDDCSTKKGRAALQPEYERRVRADGERAANAWFRGEAAVLHREVRAREKAGEC